jgi:hypothetical protein
VPRGDMCLACDDDEQNEIERGLRRIAGGRFNTPTGLSKAGSRAAMVEAAREAAASGALLQIVATAARTTMLKVGDIIVFTGAAWY